MVFVLAVFLGGLCLRLCCKLSSCLVGLLVSGLGGIDATIDVVGDESNEEFLHRCMEDGVRDEMCACGKEGKCLRCLRDTSLLILYILV